METTIEAKRVKRNMVLSSRVVLRLEEQATRERRTKSAVIERALIEYLDRAASGEQARAS